MTINSGPAGGLPEQPGPEEKPARTTTVRDRPTMGAPETRSASLGGPQSDDISHLRENAEQTRKKIASDLAGANRMKLGATAVAVLMAFLWARRRRASRRLTRWDRTMSRARQVAAAPDTTPRAQGAAATIATLAALRMLRRIARRTPSS